MTKSILKQQINLQKSPDDPSGCTYTTSWHEDWTMGSVLHGGCVAAAIHQAAETHLVTDPKLKARNQPDVMKLHLEFLYQCVRSPGVIKISTLRAGATACTLQLHLFQHDELKVVGLATSTKFDIPLGPSAPTAWTLLPPPKPIPDFNNWPDDHWLPARIVGPILPFTSRFVYLNPRGGFTVPGICDGWYGFMNGERMDATYLALMTDVIPSMSDTLTRNNGLYDAHAAFRKMEDWAETKDPRTVAVITNSVKEAMKAETHNATVTLDIEYKRRLPPQGLEWVFTRTAVRMMEAGRMDVEMTMCDETMGLVAVAQQMILVLPAQRKFAPRPASGGSKNDQKTKSVL
ncbi:thioesterase-like superfamily-domain-containing protein [Podospora australis]|uniref:Thioesterase-like superfamily-domain-containing protein n=1 Tax=Podospora australis TaxID=1536484 RepID=A0AAN6WJX2_9PEZI|nr:thioesterase-like superfamily-domain-containing protein [Podospora australis]